jgi:hypothetical protein
MKRYGKAFWKSLFWHQNKWHRHGVLIHTLKVVYHVAKVKRYDLIPAAVLHDVAKPLTAYHDAEDIEGGSVDYSFTNHEELSYRIIKNIPWVSDYTKNIVRYHYHIRGMFKARQKGQAGKLHRYKREWKKLTPEFKNDLAVFLKADDLAKK